MKQTQFHDEFKRLLDEFVHSIYDLTLTFPKEELYGVISQIRRAALSVILNYTEGYARQTKPTIKHFLIISYGSLKETKYLLYFCYKRKYITKKDYEEVLEKSERI